MTKEQPPCEKHDCPHQLTCKHQHLACSVFLHYVRTGRARKPVTDEAPVRWRYLLLFPADIDLS